MSDPIDDIQPTLPAATPVPDETNAPAASAQPELIQADPDPKPQLIPPKACFVGRYVRHYDWLCARPKEQISYKASHLYFELANYARGGINPTQKELAKLLHVTPRQTQHYLDELENLGLIAATQIGLNKPNKYNFLDHAWLRTASQTASEAGHETGFASGHETGFASKSETSFAPGSIKNSTKNSTYITPIIPFNGDLEKQSKEVLEYLNAKAGRTYRPTAQNLKLIGDRIKGVKGDTAGIKQMIDRQVTLWKGDPKMDRYLTPKTLFRLSNFDAYYDDRSQPANPKTNGARKPNRTPFANTNYSGKL